MVTLLERVSLEQAMKLAYGHRITVVSERGVLTEYELLRYSGFARDIGCHVFLVRLPSGSLATCSDLELGLRGTSAIARLGEPERLAVPQAYATSA